MTYSLAYEQGWTAYKKGKHNFNPYMKGTKERAAWFWGNWDAQLAMIS